MSKTTMAMVAALLAASMGLGGCWSTVVGEGAGLFMGASGVHAVTQPMSSDDGARPLGEYTRFVMGEWSDDFGGKVPDRLFTLLPGKFAEAREHAKLPNDPGGKTLVVRGRVLHYESENLFGMITGPLEEAVARVELVDQETGRVLAAGNCIGRTEERVNQGVEKKAEGLAKAIVKWISSRYPDRDEADEE